MNLLPIWWMGLFTGLGVDRLILTMMIYLGIESSQLDTAGFPAGFWLVT